MTMQSLRGAPRTLRQIFAMPLLLGILTTIGLIAALVGDGIWDGVSWLTLAVPVAICAWCLAIRGV
jgi:hypothetical protein